MSVSTLPQTQNYLAGQIFDLTRGERRQRIYAGVLTTYTFQITVPLTGTYSYDVDGKTVSYAATVGPDTVDTIALALQVDHVGNDEVFRIANATAATDTTTISGRTINDTFVVNNPVDGAGTAILTNTTNTLVDLVPGVAVALASEDEIRLLAAITDVVFGVASFSMANDMRLYTGDTSATDAYQQSSIVDVTTKGEIPVLVEMAIAVGEAVWVRAVATGSEVAGAFRNAVDGTDTIQLTNARWTSPSYTDGGGNLVALLTISAP